MDKNLFVRAPQGIDNPKDIKRIDRELQTITPACFFTPPFGTEPTRENDGTWKVIILDKNAMDWVKRLLKKYNIEVVREE
ncbi:MAG: hypothetical protein NTW11_03660 [Candidatus Staskawiczbacteria bacterium]|nr:hypothetical protein [Candidatus Staskawiczbacteria bacterium]